MSARVIRGIATLGAFVVIQAAFGKEREAFQYTFPSIIQVPQDFDECRVSLAERFNGEGERSAKLTIASDGTLEEFSLPDSSPEWMTELSACAFKQLRFLPAMRNGKTVPWPANLTIRLRASATESGSHVEVAGIGPLITPPLLRRNESVDSCFRTAAFVNMSRFVVRLKIRSDGSVTDLELPVGSDAWHEKTAQCVVKRIAFTPGSLDGTPVDAEASLPIVLDRGEGKPIIPGMRSTNEELESAYRKCYPPDLLSMASAFFTFEIAANGRVTNARLAKGTGDMRLDEAGACILKLIEFTPMMRDGHAIRSKVTWELPLRPPR